MVDSEHTELRDRILREGAKLRMNEVLSKESNLFASKEGLRSMDATPELDSEGRATVVIVNFGGGFNRLSAKDFGGYAKRLVFCVDKALYPIRKQLGYLGCYRYLPTKGLSGSQPGLYLAFESRSDAVAFLRALQVRLPPVGHCPQFFRSASNIMS